MTGLALVEPVEVVDERAEARRALDALDRALDDWSESTVALCLAAHDAQRARAWEACEDFTHERDFGRLALVQRRPAADREPVTDWLATYCRWRGVDVGWRQVRNLAAAGRAYRLLELGIKGDDVCTGGAHPVAMPENERQLRQLTKGVNLTENGRPVPDDVAAAHLAESWEVAFERAEGDPAKAAAEFPAVAAKSGFRPLARRYTPMTKEMRRQLAALRWDSDLDRLFVELRRFYPQGRGTVREKVAAFTAWMEAEDAAHAAT